MIDTSAFSYLARVALGDTADTRLVGYRVRFEAPDPVPDLDRLAVNAFAFEGRAAADIDAAEAVGAERYCSGPGCVLRAPVTLPSGTWVRRIELAAYDTGTGAVRASLQRCAVGAESCEELAAVATGGPAGDVLEGADLIPPAAVDNAGFTTMLEVSLDGGSEHRLRAVHLVVDRSLFRDGFESGDTGAWSSAVP